MRGLTETKESGICECCSDRQKERIGFFAVAKTYNSGDSLVVTHLTTNPPVSCLSKAERTGSPVLKILWSYVEKLSKMNVHNLANTSATNLQDEYRDPYNLGSIRQITGSSFLLFCPIYTPQHSVLLNLNQDISAV
jgi:hypothetical protein